MDPTVIQSDDLYVTVVKQFFLEEGTIQFHHRVETGSGHLGYPGYLGHVLSSQLGLIWFIKYPGVTRILH